MEYIQCPQCEKKFGVNDRVRAAAGKKIRCKHCESVFEIVILGTPAKPEPATPPKPEQSAGQLQGETAVGQQLFPEGNHAPSANQQSTEKQTKHASQSKKSGLTMQMVVSGLLGTILLALSIGGYLYINYPEMFGAAAPDESRQIIPQPMVDPIRVLPDGQEADKSAAAKQKGDTAKLQSGTERMPRPATKPKTLLDGPDNPTQVCKDVASDYWIRIHAMATGKVTSETYMKLLDQSLEQADEVRKLCKDSQLVGRITNAARAEKRPDWISEEIDRRMESDRQITEEDAF